MTITTGHASVSFKDKKSCGGGEGKELSGSLDSVPLHPSESSNVLQAKIHQIRLCNQSLRCFHLYYEEKVRFNGSKGHYSKLQIKFHR